MNWRQTVYRKIGGFLSVGGLAAAVSIVPSDDRIDKTRHVHGLPQQAPKSSPTAQTSYTKQTSADVALSKSTDSQRIACAKYFGPHATIMRMESEDAQCCDSQARACVTIEPDGYIKNKKFEVDK